MKPLASPQETVTPTELLEWDRKHVWHSFTQMRHYDPFVVESAEGCRLKDIHGREYIDGVSSLWCNVHGHRHPVLDEAIESQLRKVAHVTNLGASNSTTIRLAKALVDLTPGGLEHVFFCSDGANAIEVALKMAFQFWQQCETPRPRRTAYVALSDAYHGDTIGTVSVGDVPLFHQMFRPLLFEPIRFRAPNACDYATENERQQAVRDHLNQLDQIFRERGDEIAAIVAEPLMQGAAGIKIHPPGLLRGIAQLARKHDILLIADEVAVGFGRTGKMFACEHEDVQPDFLCLGKGLSGGYLPISATLTTERIYQAFLGDYSDQRTFYHGHTFAGNPLAAAVSLANLRLFHENRTLDKLVPKTDLIRERVERLSRFETIRHPRSIGMVAAFDLNVPDGQCATSWGYDFCARVQAQGVRIRPLGSTVIIMPPLVIDESDLSEIFAAVEQVLGDWERRC